MKVKFKSRRVTLVLFGGESAKGRVLNQPDIRLLYHDPYRKSKMYEELRECSIASDSHRSQNARIVRLNIGNFTVYSF